MAQELSAHYLNEIELPFSPPAARRAIAVLPRSSGLARKLDGRGERSSFWQNTRRMLHSLPDASCRVRALQKNHSQTRRRSMGSRRRDHPQPEPRPFSAEGPDRTNPTQSHRPRWRPTHPQRMGRRAAILRFHLPEVSPLPQSTPAMNQPVTH